MPIANIARGGRFVNLSVKKPHILIKGDNYHAMSILSYTHKNKIDVICIDSPYKTGRQDFKK